jgi:hypothetical protein
MTSQNRSQPTRRERESRAGTVRAIESVVREQ